MAKGPQIEEFELQIHKINILEEEVRTGSADNAYRNFEVSHTRPFVARRSDSLQNPIAYIDVEWFGLSQTSTFKHLDIFAEKCGIKWR